MTRYVLEVAVAWLSFGIVLVAVFMAAKRADEEAEMLERARRRRIMARLSLAHRGSVRYSEPEDAA